MNLAGFYDQTNLVIKNTLRCILIAKSSEPDFYVLSFNYKMEPSDDVLVHYLSFFFLGFCNLSFHI